jgi:hypothetical protein
MDYYSVMNLILENPDKARGYKELLNYYTINKMPEQAAAIEIILKIKNENNMPNTDQKQ